MADSKFQFIVVDDEKDVRLLVRSVIERYFPAAEIMEAGNGQEALTVFNTRGANLIIMDHHIPYLDGLSLVRLLRSQNVTIPLVLMSNNPRIETEAPTAGATVFINKLQLYETLERLLPTWLASARA